MKNYTSFNREERFWCFLLAHSILTSKNIRKKILQKIENKTDILLDKNSLEVFIETAILRDYWHTLNDNEKVKFLKEILAISEIKDISIENERLFYTTDKKTKIVSPSKWQEKFIENFNDDTKEKLLMIKWAFNAKPDIMLLDNNSFVFIEAKIESKEDKYKSKLFKNLNFKSQTDIQKFIAKIITNLIEYFKNKKFKIVFLTKNSNELNWKEIKQIILEDKEIDNFTKNCFNSTELF